MLDVTVFWPIRPDGRTVAVTQNAERRKHTTYQTRDGNGARLTNLPLVPVAVNVFGSVGEEAATYFDSVELVAKQRKRPYRPALSGPRTLTELTALLTMVSIYSHRGGHRGGSTFAAPRAGGPGLARLAHVRHMRQIAHGSADHVQEVP